MQYNHKNQDLDLICLVPLEQPAVQEYWHLNGSKFFRWTIILERWKYTTKLLAIWISELLPNLLFGTAKSSDHDISLSDFLVSAIDRVSNITCSD